MKEGRSQTIKISMDLALSKKSKGRKGDKKHYAMTFNFGSNNKRTIHNKSDRQSWTSNIPSWTIGDIEVPAKVKVQIMKEWW